MIAPIHGGTRVIALLGDPVAHSLSPRFQNAAFRAASLDGVYVALRCDPEALPGLLRGLARAGGGGNVTVPHKALAATVVDRRTPAVELTGACNTFWLSDAQVWGDNTDVSGFTQAVRSLLGGAARGLRVLLLGAGGAASAALCALVQEGAREVVIVNRTAARARALADRFRSAATELRCAPDEGSLRGGAFDLVVNATSLGLHPADPHPLPAAAAVRFEAALDLVYAPGGTPWSRALATQGIRVADGREMLLHQGAAAFERWWGREAPLEVMRAALGEPDG